MQNITNPGIFFPIMVYLSGLVAHKLGFGIGRGSQGLDKQLAAMALGFGIQSPALLVTVIASGLLLLQGFNFWNTFSAILLLSSVFTIVTLLALRIEKPHIPLSVSYRGLWVFFWYVESVNFGVSLIPLIILYRYPYYVRDLILPQWSSACGFICIMSVLLGITFFILNRWLIFRKWPQTQLPDFARPERPARVSTIRRIWSVLRKVIVPFALIVLILLLVIADANSAVFTPWIDFGSAQEDRYYYHSPYAYPYKFDYYMTLTPDRDGRLVGTIYALYNVTYTIIQPELYSLEQCVSYLNPAGVSYVLAKSNYNYASWSYPVPSYFTLNQLGADSTSLVSVPTSTNTTRIE
jgi:hypothetical protein